MKEVVIYPERPLPHNQGFEDISVCYEGVRVVASHIVTSVSIDIALQLL